MESVTERLPCGWYGTLTRFLGASEGEWLECLRRDHELRMNEVADESQVRAWRDSFRVLHEQFGSLVGNTPAAALST